MIRGALARQGKAIRVSLGVTDQFGDEYQLKDIMIRTHQPVLPKAPWKVRIASHLRKVPGLRSGAQPESLPAEWQHGGTFEDADLILNEERRVYAAHGRREGGLGSLNVGLQSAPPSLLWDKEHAKRIDSTNTARLIKLHSALDDAGRASLEQYLLTHLHKSSPYADVSYFIFLGLHRMGRTIDALQAARARLAGDKVYGYSNVLGILSALVSHEHREIDPGRSWQHWRGKLNTISA